MTKIEAKVDVILREMKTEIRTNQERMEARIEANQTHGGEANLPVDSRSGGCLSNTKGCLLYSPYSCLPAARSKVHS